MEKKITVRQRREGLSGKSQEKLVFTVTQSTFLISNHIISSNLILLTKLKDTENVETRGLAIVV